MQEQGLMSEYRALRGAIRRPLQGPKVQKKQQPHQQHQEKKTREKGKDGQGEHPQAHGKKLSSLVARDGTKSLILKSRK